MTAVVKIENNDDILLKIRFFFFLQLLDSGIQSNLDMERPYVVDTTGDLSRPLRPREYSIPEKSIMELFNPSAQHHQRPRS